MDPSIWGVAKSTIDDRRATTTAADGNSSLSFPPTFPFPPHHKSFQNVLPSDCRDRRGLQAPLPAHSQDHHSPERTLCSLFKGSRGSCCRRKEAAFQEPLRTPSQDRPQLGNRCLLQNRTPPRQSTSPSPPPLSSSSSSNLFSFPFPTLLPPPLSLPPSLPSPSPLFHPPTQPPQPPRLPHLIFPSLNRALTDPTKLSKLSNFKYFVSSPSRPNQHQLIFCASRQQTHREGLLMCTSSRT